MKFISKLSPRERMFFYIATAVIMLFLVDHFIFNLMLGKINELDERIQTLKSELRSNKELIAIKDKINRENEIYGKYLVKEEKPDMELSKTVATLAIQSELANHQLKPIQSKEANKFLIEINAEGKMKNVVNFIYNLNLVPSLLRVEKIDLSPKAAKSEILRINILISKTVVQ